MSAPIPVPPPYIVREVKKLPSESCKTVPIVLDECCWAAKWPELQKACYLARVCPIIPPKSCQFRNIPSQLQIGPTCGLTALSMLLEGTPKAEELLQVAKYLNYTKNGELFSAQFLFELIHKYFIDDNENKSCQLHDSTLNCDRIRQSLLEGACIFVPYDPDFNHSPCLRNGHRAHWALVIGYLITKEDEVYVIARHGKAKNLAVWSLKDLSDSNANLFEFSQPKGYPECDFLLPPGGISGALGLRERAIIVKGMQQYLIQIECKI